MTLANAERTAGLTQPLPMGETILWQGEPDPRLLATSMFHLRLVLGYFFAAAAVVMIASHRAGYSGSQSFAAATLLVPVAIGAIAILATIGRMSARATTYTLTNRRMILHVGVAYEMTISVPLSAITGAAVARGRGPGGDIALTVSDTGGVSYIALWPHARPWHWRRPQPMLRGLADVEQAVALIGDALTAFNTGGRRMRRAEIVLPLVPAVAA